MSARLPVVVLASGDKSELPAGDSIGGIRVIVDSTTARTLSAADDGCLIWFTSTSAITVTVPQQSTEALRAGFGCSLVQGNTGQITVAKQGTDTLGSDSGKLKSSVRYGAIAVSLIIAAAPATWWAGGNLAA